jgi:hypothetical protein
MTTNRIARALVLVLAVAARLVSGFNVGPARADAPVARPYAVVLCKYADHPETPAGPSFSQMFTAAGRGQGGLYDYWHDVSYGHISLDGSQVFGWFTMTGTFRQEMARTRYQKIRDCIAAAESAVNFAGFYGIVAITNFRDTSVNPPLGDSGSVGNQNGSGPVPAVINGHGGQWGMVLLDPGAWSVTFAPLRTLCGVPFED